MLKQSTSTLGSGLSVRVLVIGGNVGGLATAISFRCSGHEAVVFESRDCIAPVLNCGSNILGFRAYRFSPSALPSQEVTGGTRLPPSVTKILYQWGYEESLRPVAVKSSAVDFYLRRSIYKIILLNSFSSDVFMMSSGHWRKIRWTCVGRTIDSRRMR
jgi:salicylate hydroxylase